MDNKEKLYEKIKKLLNLSGSPNENEASVAFDKAQQLLQKHNLSMFEVENMEEGDAIISHCVIDFTPGVARWERRLMSAIAENLSCKMLRTLTKNMLGTKRVSFSVVGHKTDVEVFNYLLTYLLRAVKELGKKEMKHYTGQSGNTRKMYREHFLYGIVANIAERVDQKYERQKVSAEFGAMILSRESSVKNYLNNLNVKKGISRKIRVTQQAFQKGYEVGNGIGLNDGLDESKLQRQKQLN